MSDFDLGDLQVTNGGLDAFLGETPEPVTPPPKLAAIPSRVGRMRVASLAQLTGFVRTAEDTLVHKSDRDLWSLRKDGHGEFYIERMFDDQGTPLKG
jgi:hypothetical protein